MRTTSCHGPGGVVTRDLGVAPVPPPPAWGGLTHMNSLSGLEGDARRRVHDNNVRIGWGDAESYEAYMEEYLRGARFCRTHAELRAYGPPAPPPSLRPPGATLREELELENGPAQAFKHAWLAAHRDLGGMILRLGGRPVPLDAFFEGSVTAKVEAGGRSWGGTLSTRSGATAEAAASVGPATVTIPGRGRAEVGLEAGVVGAKATMAGGRIEKVEVSVRALPGVAVRASRTSGAIEHALAVGGKLGGAGGTPALHVEAKAAVGVNLLSAEAVRRALSRRSFWSEE